ncbi:DUF3846 domain-containing protein [Nonomuraea sp. NPDC046802]|uniref:DUF3846 domain-containing protein n=1 Tax=Nonomuraea sp. NPDC046802 TaxID=3154919 RepID=UPI0033E5D491
MKALRIGEHGDLTEVDLPDESAARIAVTRKLVAAESVEALTLTSRGSAWLDENGIIVGRPVNQHATALARCCGLGVTLRGPVVVTGAGPEDGTTAPLTAEQVTAIRNKVTIGLDGGS